MSQSGGEVHFSHSPLFLALQDGFDRLFDVFQSDKFVFRVNGESVNTTVIEAVLISSKVHENLRSSPGACTFCINDTNITATNFRRFLEFVHSGVLSIFSREELLSFLSICGLLGNEQLTFLLIESQKMESVEHSEPLKGQFCDHCASHFHSYSVDLLRRLSKSTLHNVVNSPFLKLEDEDEFLRLLIDLGPDYLEFWNYIEVINLTADGLSLFVDKLDFDSLNELLWQKVIVRLKGNVDMDLKSRRYLPRGVGFKSLIVKEYPDILAEFKRHTWKLLYRGSRDGFGASHFHAKCDNQPNTVTFVETTKGFIFGGFTPIAWVSGTNSYKSDDSQTSFVFTLKNGGNVSPRKFALLSASTAIWSGPSYGPIFGNGHDFRIYDNCNQNTNNSTKLGVGYANDTGINGNQILAGKPFSQYPAPEKRHRPLMPIVRRIIKGNKPPTSPDGCQRHDCRKRIPPNRQNPKL
jgi:hypothetical protein